jgi:hypothetical protein
MSIYAIKSLGFKACSARDLKAVFRSGQKPTKFERPLLALSRHDRPRLRCPLVE